MKLSGIIFIISLLTIFSCNKTPDTNFYYPTYESINMFLSEIIESDSNHFENPKGLYPLLLPNKNIEHMFESFPQVQDEFDLDQLKYNDSTFAYMHLNPGFFKGFQLVDIDTDKPYRTFKLPLYSKDGKLCLIDIGYKIGLLSGVGYTVLYKKRSGYWIEFDRKRSWIE